MGGECSFAQLPHSMERSLNCAQHACRFGEIPTFGFPTAGQRKTPRLRISTTVAADLRIALRI